MIIEEDIYIRDAYRTDVPLVFEWENDPKNWEVSDRTSPYTIQDIAALLASSENYLETYQKRWLIVKKKDDLPIGTVDVFRGDLPENETSVGILIAKQRDRRKGYAESAIRLAIDVCQRELGIAKIHALVHDTNKGSIRLFEKLGFERQKSKEDYSNFEQGNLLTLKFVLCLKE